MEKENEFLRGLKDAIPVCLGYLAVSFAFGIQAAEAGLSVFQASLMSITNVTSAGQFSSLELIATNAAYAEMALLQLVVNLRYMLMSTALSQKLSSKESTLSRCLVAYGVTDEIFALSVLRKGRLKPAYSYGLIICSVFGWVMGTFLGAFLDRDLSVRAVYFEFAGTARFLVGNVPDCVLYGECLNNLVFLQHFLELDHFVLF